MSTDLLQCLDRLTDFIVFRSGNVGEVQPDSDGHEARETRVGARTTQAERTFVFEDIWNERTLTLHSMVMDSKISQDVRENAIKSWLSGLTIEEKVRACQYMYDNLPNRTMYEMGKDVLALYCKRIGVAIKTLYSGWF